jgi:aminoglycoside 3-N-acetyltransferase I
MADRGFTTRRLRRGDAALLEKLNQLFADAFDDPDSYAGARPARSYLERLLRKASIIALVAQAEDEIIGGLVAYELDKFEQARREIYIYDLAVAATQRRQGVATALVERLKSIARRRGAWVIYVQADYGDDPAIALYEKLGVREDVMHFDISPEA